MVSEVETELVPELVDFFRKLPEYVVGLDIAGQLLELLHIDSELLLLGVENVDDRLDFFFAHFEDVPLQILVLPQLDVGVNLLLLLHVKFGQLVVEIQEQLVLQRVHHLAEPLLYLIALIRYLLDDVYRLPLHLRVEILGPVIHVGCLLADLTPLQLHVLNLHFLMGAVVLKKAVRAAQSLHRLAVRLQANIGHLAPLVRPLVANYVRFQVKLVVASDRFVDGGLVRRIG